MLGAGRLGRALAARAAARGVRAGLWRRQHEMPAGPQPTVPVVLALPLERIREVDPEPLAGRVVVDAMNAWGDAATGPGAPARTVGTSEAVAEHLHRSRVVKTLNHLSYRELGEEPEVTRGLVVAGDDPGARTLVARLVARMGFAPVQVPHLADGRITEPGRALFGGHPSAAAMRSVLEEHGIAHTDRHGIPHEAPPVTGHGAAGRHRGIRARAC